MYRIVSSGEVFAAHSFLPADFLSHPCGNCPHGSGQHLEKPNAPNRTYGRGSGKCTAPGCDCLHYEHGQQFLWELKNILTFVLVLIHSGTERTR